VQTFESWQLRGLPEQRSLLQVSLIVQYNPSSHAAVLLVWPQPVAGLQESSVQASPSLQFGGGPPTHVPAWHLSPVVHALPSSHATALLVWTQPVGGVQESSVQPLPSLQLGAGPPTHVPATHLSAVVHAFPSLHGEVLLVWPQPVAGLQESLVQGLPSLQLVVGPSPHTPSTQSSPVVHAFSSSHGAMLFSWTQPMAGLQESSVQTL